VLDEGAAFGDYDLDGDLDLYVAYTDIDGFVMWRNRGDGSFEEAADAAAPDVGLISLGLSIEDWDADGDLDLTTQYEFWRNQLFETGIPRYTIASHTIDSDDIQAATPSWVDFDRDGDLDAYLGDWQSTGNLYENTTYDAATPPGDVRTVRILSDDPAFPDGLETEFGAIAEVVVHGEPGGRRFRKFVASGSGYLNQNECTLTFALPADPADPTFDVSVDFPSRAADGQWRVDRTVNPALGDLRLVDLEDREIRVFRSGELRVDGVDAGPDPLETPPLFATGGGLPGPRTGSRWPGRPTPPRTPGSGWRSTPPRPPACGSSWSTGPRRTRSTAAATRSCGT
jgi:hypothetical protein